MRAFLKDFNRYLNLLDYSHNVLLASDIAQFIKETKAGEDWKKQSFSPFMISLLIYAKKDVWIVFIMSKPPDKLVDLLAKISLS